MRQFRGLTGTIVAVIGLASGLGGVSSLLGQDSGGSAPMLVLDATSYWRLHMSWKTPAVLGDDGGISVPLVGKAGRPMKQWQTAGPPGEWTQVSFDDSGWSRGQCPLGVDAWVGGAVPSPGSPAEVNTLCVRGRFLVDDPCSVQGLRLSVDYFGGAAVYLNGRELARGNLPAGELSADTLAEGYPPEAYVAPDGTTLLESSYRNEFAECFAVRTRKLSGVAIGAEHLRRGVNVLAIAIHRAPVREVAISKPRTTSGRVISPWPHARLLGARLTASAGSAIRPNLVRPDGFQVWLCPPLENVFTWDYGDPADDPPSVCIAAVRNGTHSARLAVSSTQPIRGLEAQVSELAQAKGVVRLPASAVQVQYSLVADRRNCWLEEDGPGLNCRFDILAEKPPPEVAVVGVPESRRGSSRSADESVAVQEQLLSRRWRVNWFHYDTWLAFRSLPKNVELPQAAKPRPGAVQPIWLTVKVPAEAAGGDYHGRVTIRAEGTGPVTLPVTVKVHDWKLPDRRRFVTHNNFYNSVDTLALRYETPLWSQRHWELIRQSLELSGQVGNRLCAVPLLVRAYNVGNAESMVRWIRLDDGGCDHDFSVFDQYLDLYEKTLGKPGVVKLYVWGRYGNKTPDLYKVSRLDPATGQVEEMRQPPYGTPESVAFWKPVMDKVRQRLEKRGWMDIAALAVGPDEGPDPITVTMFRAIWPDGRWMSSAHPNPTQYKGAEKETVPVPYVEHVWAAGELYDPDYNRNLAMYRPDQEWLGRAYPRPWKRMPQRVEWAFPRYGVRCIHALRDNSSLSSFRWASESALQGNLNGIGNCGADLWPLPGRKSSLAGDSHMGPAASLQALLSAGPHGPAVTERFEMFREGLQVCEAIIFVQQALDSGRVAGDLAQRVEDLLDARARHYVRSRFGHEVLWWGLNTDYLKREEQLFGLCAEVARATGQSR